MMFHEGSLGGWTNPLEAADWPDNSPCWPSMMVKASWHRWPRLVFMLLSLQLGREEILALRD